MSELNQHLQETLSEEDRQTMDKVAKGSGLFELFALMFSGKQAWIIGYLYAVSFAVFIAAILFYDGYQQATDIRAALDWALLLIACMLLFTIIKIVGWQHMCKQEILQEMRRLEMRLMLINDKSRQ